MSAQSPRDFMNRTTPPHVITLVVLMAVSAMTINLFLASLPALAEHFDAPYALVQLSIALYLAASAIVQLFVGPLADKFGRRPVLLIGLMIFLIGTVGCLYAPTIGSFLFFRVLQAAAAVAMALSRAIVRDMHEPNKAASVMGYVTMGMSMVPMLAPALGGVLDEMFGWQASFWLLLGSGLLIFALTWLDLGETGRPSKLTLWGQFKEYPEILRARRFWGYSLASAFSSGAFFAYIGGAPYVAMTLFSLSPAEFGLFNGCAAVGYFLGNWATGVFAARVGMNRMILIGTLTVTSGLTLAIVLTLSGISNPYGFFGPMVFVGLGNGMVIPSANTGMLSVRPHLAGTAAGLGGALMIGGGAALSAVAGSLLGPGATEMPLLLLMLAAAVCGVVSILFVMRREAKLGLSTGRV